MNPKQLGAILVLAGILIAVQLGMTFQKKARTIDVEVEKARAEEKALETQLGVEKVHRLLLDHAIDFVEEFDVVRVDRVHRGPRDRRELRRGPLRPGPYPTESGRPKACQCHHGAIRADP